MRARSALNAAGELSDRSLKNFRRDEARARVHDEQTGAKKCFVSSDITRPRRYLFITELSSHM